MTIEEKRRELFEVWVKREWPSAPLRYVRDALPANDPRYGEYCDESLQRSWVGWQAALDAVVIELPERDTSSAGGPDSEMGPSYEQVEGCGYNYALGDCRAAIESTGLGLKVKS